MSIVSGTDCSRRSGPPRTAAVHRWWATTLLVLPPALLVAPATARVPAEQAAKLSGELTPLGGTRAGNAEGTIPAWTGGLTKPPPGYRRGAHHPDPFPADRPRLTIDSKSAAAQRSRLSPGQLALLNKYGTFRMLIYPTRRSAACPPRVYAATLANATRAQLTGNGSGVQQAVRGIPFPIPRDGREAIWNTLLRYRGEAVRRYPYQATVTAGGAYSLTKVEEEYLYRYYRSAKPQDLGNIAFYFKQRFNAPARLAGTLTLVHETLDQVAEQRHAWIYTPGLRRVRRAPNVAYDSPPGSADGLRTFDQYDMFNGAIDRYDWTLVGKQELYVPYNAYRLHSGDVRVKQIIRPHHINTKLARYELHRVWKVEARLKRGSRNIYARRTFYLDEDSWQPLVVDHYDKRGKLWRVAEAHAVNYYEVPLLWSTLDVIYDLHSGRYIAMGLNNEHKEDDFGVDLSRRDFDPSALRRRGLR